MLGQDARPQAARALAQHGLVQRVVQALQHVGKAKAPGLLFQLLQARFHLCGGVGAQRGGRGRHAGHGGEQGFESPEMVRQIDASAFTQRIEHASRHQARQRCAVLGQRQKLRLWITCPGHHRIQPAIDTPGLQHAAVEDAHFRR